MQMASLVEAAVSGHTQLQGAHSLQQTKLDMLNKVGTDSKGTYQ